ncbi:MAG: hypothetical protein JNM39_03015 [Bdellovibrionaceae bacterium]|nr:hypothetical protein [Pseudobdellovibrionaceae bacterium]
MPIIFCVLLGNPVLAEKPGSQKLDLGPAKVAFIGNVKSSDFDSRFLPFYKKVAQCEKCELVNLTPYTESSEVDFEKLWPTVLGVSSEYSIIYLHWNEPTNKKTEVLVDQLNDKLSHSVVLVGYAGQPKTTGPTIPLNKTILGQIHQALIVGELTERERLLPQLFWGPEMITAVKPPREYLEQGLSPLLFVSTLAKKVHQRKSQDWPDHLRLRKSKNKKLWPEINDLF